MILNIAHRGLSGLYPENTVLAFEKALALNVNAMETDVQLSKDGKMMIFHDEDLSRMTGEEGMLTDRTFAELRELDASGKYRGRFGRCVIPTLDEYLELVSERDMITYLELKTGIIPYDIEEKVRDALRRHGMQDKVYVYSANHFSVMKFRKLAPEIKIAFPFDNWIFHCGDYSAKYGAEAMVPYYLMLTPELVAEIKGHGILLTPWTVDEPGEMRRMLDLGVDGLMTNRADLFSEVIKERE